MPELLMRIVVVNELLPLEPSMQAAAQARRIHFSPETDDGLVRKILCAFAPFFFFALKKKPLRTS